MESERYEIGGPRRRARAALTRRRVLGVLAGAALAGRAGAGAAAPAGAAAQDGRLGFEAKAIYLDPRVTQGPQAVGALLGLIERTELNALVVDVKEYGVYFDTDVEFFRDAGALVPLYDPAELLAELRQRGIYSIARLVCFKDTAVATARPELAVRNRSSGGVWHDNAGHGWVNPLQSEIWEANAALAAEVAALGFDEIQYDYVRFPTDGNLGATDYGQPTSERVRTDAILDFIDLTQQALAPYATKLSADIFGFTLVVDDDLGIGQNAELIGRAVDYVCPMVYPSHWPNGSLAVGGHPNDFPYETIALSLDFAKDKLPDDVKRIRPWLQGFSLPGMRAYGPEDVRAQIDAAEEAGVGGWMIWDMGNRYFEEAFEASR